MESLVEYNNISSLMISKISLKIPNNNDFINTRLIKTPDAPRHKKLSLEVSNDNIIEIGYKTPDAPKNSKRKYFFENE